MSEQKHPTLLLPESLVDEIKIGRNTCVVIVFRDDFGGIKIQCSPSNTRNGYGCRPLSRNSQSEGCPLRDNHFVPLSALLSFELK